MRCSCRDSLGMSTRAAVRAIGSARKSRPTVANRSPVAFGTVTSASGIGVATISAEGTVLDTWFPEPEVGDAASVSADGDATTGTNRLSVAEVPSELGDLTGRDEERDVDVVVVRTTIS